MEEHGIIITSPKVVNLRDGKRLLDVVIDDGKGKNTHRFWNQEVDAFKNAKAGDKINFKRGNEFLQDFRKENQIKTHKIFNAYSPKLIQEKEQLFKVTGYLASDLQQKKMNYQGNEFLVVRGAIVENGNYTNIQIAGKNAEKFLNLVEGGKKGQKLSIQGLPKMKEYLSKDGVKQEFKFLEPVKTYSHKMLENKELNVAKVNLTELNGKTNAQVYGWADEKQNNKIVNTGYTISMKNISPTQVEQIKNLKNNDKIQVTGDRAKIFDEVKNKDYNFINPFVLNKLEKGEKKTTIIDKTASYKEKKQDIKPVIKNENSKKQQVSM